MPRIQLKFNSFLLLFLSYFLTANARSADLFLDGVAAVVGDAPVLFSDVKKLKGEISNVPLLAQAYRLEGKNISDSQILDRLIEEKIVKIETKALEIRISDAEIENQLKSIAKQNGITRAQLEASLKAEKISIEAHKENIRSQLERRDLFDRVLRRGGGVSEEELRKIYFETAPKELKIFALSVRNNELARKNFEGLKQRVELGRAPFREIVAQSGAEEVGWVPVDQLDPKVAKVLADAKAGKAYGPMEVKGVLQLIFVDSLRSGSEESFQARKNELMVKAQSEDFENRFTFWLESKKRELHIVVNTK